MYQIDNQSRYAVYEQIVRQVEKYILSGVLSADQQLPSVRTLSIELSVNPNTVQRAYTELERQRLVYSITGKGTFIDPQALSQLQAKQRGSLDDLRPVIQTLRLSGVTKQEMIDLIEQIYKEEQL